MISARGDARWAIGAQLVPAVLAALVTPVLVSQLGVRAYGLVALATTASLVLASFEIGVSTAVGRAFARSEAAHLGAPVSLLHRLERRYLMVALVIGAVGCSIALGLLAVVGWDEGGPVGGAEVAIPLLVALVALRWPSPLYLSILRARARHAAAASVTASLAVIRYVGAGLAALVTQDLRWVACVMAATAAVELLLLRRNARSGLVPAREGEAIDQRFALGVTFASVLAALLKQGDKVIVASMTTLALTGLYVFAANVISAAALVAAGVYGVTAPLASGALAERDDARLRTIAVESAHLTVTLVAPLLLGVALNAHLVLDFAFPGPLAREGTTALVVLAAAGLLNAVTQVPLAIQHAAGESRYGVASNLVGVVAGLPLTALLAAHLGVTGAASGWLVFNAGYAAIIPYRSLSHIGGSALLRRWAVHGVARPAGIALLLFLPAIAATATGVDDLVRLVASALSGAGALLVNLRVRPPGGGIPGDAAPRHVTIEW